MIPLLIVLCVLMVISIISNFISKDEDNTENLNAYLDACMENDKLKEINDILVEKKVNLYDLWNSNNVDEYNELLAYGKTNEEIAMLELDNADFWFLKTYLLQQDIGE